MKPLTVAAFLSVIVAGSLHAACRSDACKRAMAWKTGYTAIILDAAITRDDYLAVLDTVRTNGGAIAIESEHVLLGWIPKEAALELRSIRGVRQIARTVAIPPADFSEQDDSLSTLRFFNRVASGEYEDDVERGLSTTGVPLVGCVQSRPPAEHIVSNFDFRTPFQNPSMRGRVTVQLFRVDSDGTIDPNLYTWPADRVNFNKARDQVLGAFSFWVSQATQRNVTLSFRVATMDPYPRLTRAYVPTAVKYEPITRSSADDYLWMNDALSQAGYGSTTVTRTNVYIRNDDLNRDKKADPTYGPFDRSFTVYVVYNPSPAPSHFTNGYNAYASYDGPRATILWNSGGWGSDNIGRVLTHETAHIFWACDEYAGGCNTCKYCIYSGGPRGQVETPWITNGNCDSGTGADCDVPRSECIMKNDDYALCSHTPQQVGW